MSDLEAWRDEWYLALSNGSVADGSRDEYVKGVDQFRAWLTDTHPDAVNIDNVTKQHINQWLTHLTHRADRPLKPATRRLRLIAVRLWFKYICGELDSPLAANPTAGIPLPEPKDQPVPVITDDELRALLDACRGPRFIDYRDTLIVRMLLDTGCRRGELVAADLEHVDRRQQQITITGKTGTRIVPFGGRTAIALTKYLRARARHQAAAEPALVLSTRQTAGSWRYTGDGVRDMIVRRAAQAGLGHKWPHMLRHTWAHDLKENGASDEDLENLGGWKPGSPVVRMYGRSEAAARARKTARRMSRGDRV